MATNTQVETVSSGADKAKLAAAATLVVASIAAFYLLTEHRAHLLGALPFLLLLACPLMHLFMHGGHGHSHGNGPPHKGENQ